MIIDLRGPLWFYGIDIAIQFVSSLIALYAAYQGYKTYKLSSEKKYLYFTGAFSLLAVDLLIYALVLPSLFVYYRDFFPLYASSLIPIAYSLNFVFIFTILMAYLLFIFVYSKIERKSIMVLLTSLVFALVIYSYVYRSFIGFNLVSIILLAFIIFYTGKNFVKRKTRNSLFAFSSFSLIGVAHLLLGLESFNNWFYIIGDIAKLIGYLGILILFIKIEQHAKKK